MILHTFRPMLFLALPLSTATFLIATASTQSPAGWLVAKGDSLMQASRESMNPDSYDNALVAYQEALAIDASNTSAMLGIAWVGNSLHQFDAGEAWARKALQLDSDLVDAYSLLGDAAVEQGEYRDAFAHYQKAMDLRPDLSTYSRAAHLLWLTGDTIRGEELMRLAISVGGPHAENTAWCRAQLGQMLFQRGALDEAIRITEQAIDDAPSNALVLAAYGILLRANGETEKAREQFEASSASSPNHVALSNLYSILKDAGESEQAQTIHDRLLAFHRHHHHTAANTRPSARDLAPPEIEAPHEHPGNYELALFWADHELRTQEAIREARRAYADYPNIAAADALAWTLHRAGESDKAVRYIEAALEWNPPYSHVLYHAGAIYFATGKLEKARELLQRALDRNPQFDANAARSAREILAKIEIAQ